MVSKRGWYGFLAACSLVLTSSMVWANPIAAGEFIYACQSDSGYHVKISYNCGDSADYPTNCGLKAVSRNGVELQGDWLGTVSDSSADLGSGITGTKVKGYWCDCHVKPGKQTYSVGSSFGDADVNVVAPGTSGIGTDFCYEGAVCDKECAGTPPPPSLHYQATTLPIGSHVVSAGGTPDVLASEEGGCTISAVRGVSAGPLLLLALLGLALATIRRRRRR